MLASQETANDQHRFSIPMAVRGALGKTHPDRPALRFNETIHSWQNFNLLSDRLACVFLEKGIGKNDVIATMLPASTAYAMALIAADKSGLLFVQLMLNTKPQICPWSCPT